jgi:hypothetical protein
MRKSIPLDKLLNRVLSVAVCDRKTAENIRDSAHKFSSPEVVNVAYARRSGSARSMELLAIEIIRWRDNSPQENHQHILNFHDEPLTGETAALQDRLIGEIKRVDSEY